MLSNFVKIKICIFLTKILKFYALSFESDFPHDMENNTEFFFYGV